MRYFLKLAGLYFLILASCYSKPQERKIEQVATDGTLPKFKLKPSETCEWGEREAKKDLAKGKLMLIRWGLEVEDGGLYWELLATKYHIYTKDEVGCVVYPAIRCYNDFMEKKIKEKYGVHFFDRLKKEIEHKIKSGEVYKWKKKTN